MSMEQNNIFHSFIWKTKLDYKEKNKLIKKIEHNYFENPDKTPKKWKCKVHSSYEDRNLSLDTIPLDLIYLIENKVNAFLDAYFRTNEIIGNYFIAEYWYNAYKGFQFQEPHEHGDSLFSGCYYLKFNKDKHCQTTFYNPNFRIEFDKLKNNPYFCYTPECEEDDLIIFPSALMHSTEGIIDKNECEELRITISFNIINDHVYNTNRSKNNLNYH